MVSCFFCQSLLSDYLEDLLPSSRHGELEKHLDHCKSCSEVQRDLVKTVEVAKGLAASPLSHETALRISEAGQAGARRLSAAQASRWAFLALIPLLLIASAAALFPGFFPGLEQWRTKKDDSQLVRYFPMQEGAAEIIEEHANWLHTRETGMRSLWEEGGISPEEFERSFTGKPNVSEEVK